MSQAYVTASGDAVAVGPLFAAPLHVVIADPFSVTAQVPVVPDGAACVAKVPDTVAVKVIVLPSVALAALVATSVGVIFAIVSAFSASVVAAV